MAINPYGMAYGIGQMLGGVPDAYYQGQQQAIQDEAARTKNQLSNVALEQQNINLSDMQRQHDESVKLNQELAQQVPEDVTKDETDPLDQQAAVLEWHANNMANSGYGKLAQSQREEAMKLRQQALASNGQKAAQMIMNGNYDDAVSILKDRHVLSDDAVIKDDPNDKDNVLITTHGSTVSMPRYQIAAVAAGDKKIWQIVWQAKAVEVKEQGKNERQEKAIASKEKLAKDKNELAVLLESMKEKYGMSKLGTSLSFRAAHPTNWEMAYYNDIVRRTGSADEAAKAIISGRQFLIDARKKDANPEAAAASAVARIEQYNPFENPAARKAAYDSYLGLFRSQTPTQKQWQPPKQGQPSSTVQSITKKLRLLGKKS